MEVVVVEGDHLQLAKGGEGGGQGPEEATAEGEDAKMMERAWEDEGRKEEKGTTIGTGGNGPSRSRSAKSREFPSSFKVSRV